MVVLLDGDSGTYDYWKNTITPQVINLIRTYNNDCWILYDPRFNPSTNDMFSMDLSYLTGVTPLTDSKVMYVQHMYHPARHTQNIGNAAPFSGYTYPSSDMGGTEGVIDKDDLIAYLAPLVTFKNTNNVPIMVGEFGCVRWAGGKDTWVTDVIDLLELYGFNWCFHAYTRDRLSEYVGFNPDYDTTFDAGVTR